MKKELIDWDNVPDDLKRNILIDGILSGEDIPVMESSIQMSKKGIHAVGNYSKQIAKALDIESELDRYADETRDAFKRLSESVYAKMVKLLESSGCTVIKTDEKGWPDKPTDISIDLANDITGEKDD